MHPVVPALVTEYEMAAEPRAVADVDGVAGDAVASRAVVGAQVTVWVAVVTVKLMFDDVADAYVESAAIETEMVQVPAETKATRPEDELTVQIEVVELVNVLVPVPADAVAVNVGAVDTIV